MHFSCLSVCLWTQLSGATFTKPFSILVTKTRSMTVCWWGGMITFSDSSSSVGESNTIVSAYTMFSPIEMHWEKKTRFHSEASNILYSITLQVPMCELHVEVN